VPLQLFKIYEKEAKDRGFLKYFCGPFVRSSYRAKDFFTK